MKIIKCKFWGSRIFSKLLNFISDLQGWMDSVQGLTFMNYAYSIGAAIVVLGTLFKLTHLPGANFFLFMGMGTEVIVFVLSAFDRPFKITNGEQTDTALTAAKDAESQMFEKEMDKNLKGTFDAVKTAYASQLKTINKGTESFEQMQEQAQQLIQKMQELNGLYARMIEAFKVKE